MQFLILALVCGLLGFYLYFSKKLLSLLMLELCFLSLISIFFFNSSDSFGVCSFFSMMLFMGFLVMDSVLGLTLLVLSSRSSSLFLDEFSSV